MKKVLTCGKNIVIAVLALLCLFELSIIRDLKSQDSDVSDLTSIIPDTVFIDRPIKVFEKYSNNKKPGKVKIFKPDTVRVLYPEVKLVKDTLILFNNENYLGINKNYLLQYPTSDKLLSFNLTKTKLDLQLLSIDGITKQTEFDINLDKYNYRYVDKELSFKTKPVVKVSPELEYSFRPVNNLHDLDLGLIFKTTRFNYKLGINTFYYPVLKTNPGYDFKVSVKYNFR